MLRASGPLVSVPSLGVERSRSVLGVGSTAQRPGRTMCSGHDAEARRMACNDYERMGHGSEAQRFDVSISLRPSLSTERKEDNGAIRPTESAFGPDQGARGSGRG